MRWAVPASVAVHVGLIAGAWLCMQSPHEDLSAAEGAVSIDIISTEEAVTEPSDTVSEASATLVSSGMTQVAQEAAEDETVETAAVEPVEAAEAELPPSVAAVAALPAADVAPTETEELISAEVITALREVEDPVAEPTPQLTDDAAPSVSETGTPNDAEIILQQPAAALEPVVEEANEIPPVPAPRVIRKPVEKKKAEKPVEKKQAKQVASLGNGGEAEADSVAAKAAGGAKGKVVTAGKGAIAAYEGKVRAKFLKAVRKPRDSDRGDVRVLFMLDANGRVVKSQLSRSSGDDKLDRAALAAVERAAPYPPIPEGSGKSTWIFTVPVSIN